MQPPGASPPVPPREQQPEQLRIGESGQFSEGLEDRGEHPPVPHGPPARCPPVRHAPPRPAAPRRLTPTPGSFPYAVPAAASRLALPDSCPPPHSATAALPAPSSSALGSPAAARRASQRSGLLRTPCSSLTPRLARRPRSRLSAPAACPPLAPAPPSKLFPC